MQITVEPRETFTILHLRGEFDTFYVPRLQKEIDGLIAAGVVHVVLNLRLVKFINSTALGAIIKASKVLGVAHGKLVISRPSAFCRDIIEKVGLDRVVPIYDSDEEAGAALSSRHSGVRQAESGEILEDETTILFSLKDASRMEHFLGRAADTVHPIHGQPLGNRWRGIGRMSSLDASGLRFTWNGGDTELSSFEMGQLLALGTELIVKFRLPLLQKGHCDAVVTVSELEERSDGVKVATRFTEIDAETRRAVEQYAADMAYLKRELRQATQD